MTAVWEKQGNETRDYTPFQEAFQLAFDTHAAGRQGGERLFDIKQGKLFVRALTPLLTPLYRGSLLDQLIVLAIGLDNLEQDCTHLSEEEDMEVDVLQMTSRLPRATRDWHNNSRRPQAESGLQQSRSSSQQVPRCTIATTPVLTIKVSVTYATLTKNVLALLDDRAASDFITAALVERLRVPLLKLPVPLRATAPSCQLSFFVLPVSEIFIVLGMPWLSRHNPHINWHTRSMTAWSPNLFTGSYVPTPSLQSIPPEYQDLLEVFSKNKATCLSFHQPWVCAINLQPGSTPPQGKIYPLLWRPM